MLKKGETTMTFSMVRIDEEVIDILRNKTQFFESRNDTLRRLLGLPPRKKVERRGRKRIKRKEEVLV